MKRLIPTIIALLVIAISPVISLADELEDAQEKVRLNPSDAMAHSILGFKYSELGRYEESLPHLKEAIQLKPNDPVAHSNLGNSFLSLNRNEEALAHIKEAIRLDPYFSYAHYNLGLYYGILGRSEEALAPLKEAIRLKPKDSFPYGHLGLSYEKLGRYEEAILKSKEALRLNPDNGLARANLGVIEQIPAWKKRPLEEENNKLEILRNQNEADRLARERRLFEEEKKRWEARRIDEENKQQSKKQSPQSGTGSGFFVSKMGHAITNAHVVQNCNNVTIGDNANKQVPAEVIYTDKSNDLALLKISSLEMASAESKSLIQKLSIAIVPLASKGLLRSEDVRLGEKVLVAGYPYGDFFSNSIKVTTGVVSSTRGTGDDSGQFQLDAAIQPGNSGGPIYDSSGNIVGVVISQLDKLKIAKAIGSLPENVNFGIKASTVRQFLISSGLPSKKTEQTNEKSTEQLAEIARNQALMVVCYQ